MEWWVKKVQDNASASLCRVVLQSGALEMIAEIEACRLRLREGDKLTPLADARYCLNNNPTQTLKIRNATHYSSGVGQTPANNTSPLPLLVMV
ncbi:TPA: signal transduction protein PmrD [Klebsiella pneumoniae]|nr:signal transduction protein PmrD [Klebsiella pneumoniae]HCQ8691083.1 signal transduction protein PmrD [Klebsiella pneumoniae]